jgi:hypothetical protein
MLEPSDMLGIHDRLHFCKFFINRGDVHFDYVANYERLYRDDIFANRDNSPYEQSHNRRNNDLMKFYKSATIFIDVLLADKLVYSLSASHSAAESFYYSKMEDREGFDRVFPHAKSQYGNYTEEQLSFALDCVDKARDQDAMDLAREARSFVLHAVLETGKYSLMDQLTILLDDEYCDYLAEEGISSFLW